MLRLHSHLAPSNIPAETPPGNEDAPQIMSGLPSCIRRYSRNRVSSCGLVRKTPRARCRDGGALALLDASLDHAEVGGLHHGDDSQRFEVSVDSPRDLLGHALLDLQPPREQRDDPRNL